MTVKMIFLGLDSFLYFSYIDENESILLLFICILDTIQDFLCELGIKPRMQIEEIIIFFATYTMTSSNVPKLLRSSVKPVHKCFLCTGFTEVLNNFGRSDDDAV